MRIHAVIRDDHGLLLMKYYTTNVSQWGFNLYYRHDLAAPWRPYVTYRVECHRFLEVMGNYMKKGQLLDIYTEGGCIIKNEEVK